MKLRTTEVFFCLKYPGNECKHTSSVMSGGNTVGRICSQYPNFHFIFPLHTMTMGAVSGCVHVCVYMHVCMCA